MCNYIYSDIIHNYVYIFIRIKKNVIEDLKNEVEDYPSTINRIYSYQNNTTEGFNNPRVYCSLKIFY